MSYPKEPCYFATDFMRESDGFHGKPKYYGVRTSEQYDKHFAHAEEGQILGDASTCYTYSKEAAHNIYEHNPEAKIIIMLRDPVEFIHSLHMQYVNDTTENEPDFKKALQLEEERKKGNHIPPRTRCPSYNFYYERAKYSEHVKRYIDTFGKDNVMIIANEEFRQNNEAVYKQILDFLEVKNDIMPDFKTVHGSKKPRFERLNKLAHVAWIKKTFYRLLGPTLYTNMQNRVNKVLLKPQERQDMDPELKKELKQKFEPEIKELDRITNKNFADIWGY